MPERLAPQGAESRSVDMVSERGRYDTSELMLCVCRNCNFPSLPGDEKHSPDCSGPDVDAFPVVHRDRLRWRCPNGCREWCGLCG